jgi:hypothetical protein
MPINQDSFNITVTSSPNEYNPSNVSHDFTVQLPKQFIFNEHWRVGLQSITYPTVFNTFNSKDINIIIEYIEDATTKELSYLIDNNKYTIESLLTTINEILGRHNFGRLSIASDDHLRYTYNKSCVLKLSSSLAHVLGFIENATRKYVAMEFVAATAGDTYEVKFDNKVNMDYYKPAYLMLYSDIVNPSLIGGRYTNILSIVNLPLKGTLDTYHFKEYNTITYHRLLNYNIYEMKFQIRSHSGNDVSFFGNKTIILNLHFIKI